MNLTTDKFQKALYSLEREGLILRGEQFLKVLNRQRCLDRALAECTEQATSVGLKFQVAISAINQDLARARHETSAWVEQRRQELLRIQVLMESLPASSSHRTRETRRPVPGMKTI